MNTIIEIQYKKYTENVIVTNENVDDVLIHLLSDKDIVDYDYVVKGNIDLEDEISKSDLACSFYVVAPPKAKTIHKMYNKLSEMKTIRHWKTNAQASKHFQDIDKLENRIVEKINKLTNLESLFV